MFLVDHRSTVKYLFEDDSIAFIRTNYDRAGARKQLIEVHCNKIRWYSS